MYAEEALGVEKKLLAHAIMSAFGVTHSCCARSLTRIVVCVPDFSGRHVGCVKPCKLFLTTLRVPHSRNSLRKQACSFPAPPSARAS